MEKGLGYEGNFQKVTYPQQMSWEVDIKPDWEQIVCQAGVPESEVKSAEPHPAEAHPHLSPHWGNETLWSLLSGLEVKTKLGKIILQTKSSLSLPCHLKEEKNKHSTGNPREEILLDQDKHSDSSAEESNQNVTINDKLNEVTWL